MCVNKYKKQLVTNDVSGGVWLKDVRMEFGLEAAGS